MSTVVIWLLVVAFIVGVGVIQAGSSAVIETIVDVLFRRSPDRKRQSPTFVTSLAVTDALAAADEAAAQLAGTHVKRGEGNLGLIVTFQSGGCISISAGVAGSSRVKLRVAPGSPPGDEGTMARFRGALLASLRKRDPSARQT
jgi:hypothetical protein